MDVASSEGIVNTSAEKVRARVAGDGPTITTKNGATNAVEQWLREIKQALADVKGKLEAGDQSHRAPLFGTDAVDLLERRFDAPRWLITGLVTRGGITMIGAEPKAAKTWLGTE